MEFSVFLLRGHLRRHKKSVDAFARSINVTTRQAFRILAGKQTPSYGTANKIEKVTGGEVPRKAWPKQRVRVDARWKEKSK